MTASPSAIASEKRWRRSTNAPRSESGLMGRSSLQAERVGQELVGADARLELVRDGDDHELLDTVGPRHHLELVAHGLRRPGDGASARVLDDREIARGVGEALGFLDRWKRPVAAGVEPQERELATPGEP